MQQLQQHQRQQQQQQQQLQQQLQQQQQRREVLVTQPSFDNSIISRQSSQTPRDDSVSLAGSEISSASSTLTRPQRKKRAAPQPPAAAADISNGSISTPQSSAIELSNRSDELHRIQDLSVHQGEVVVSSRQADIAVGGALHSRTSSRSSGFDEKVDPSSIDSPDSKNDSLVNSSLSSLSPQTNHVISSLQYVNEEIMLLQSDQKQLSAASSVEAEVSHPYDASVPDRPNRRRKAPIPPSGKLE